MHTMIEELKFSNIQNVVWHVTVSLTLKTRSLTAQENKSY